ncbi:MAG: hypothetical protein J6Q26_05150, partial [Bacteroidales bacterium]|nr:hypothetical protein [Bacteroidales bacterium]
MMKRVICMILLGCVLSYPLSAQQQNLTLPYQDWYSFEKPQEDYTKDFLKSSIAPLALAGVGLLIQSNAD